MISTQRLIPFIFFSALAGWQPATHALDLEKDLKIRLDCKKQMPAETCRLYKEAWETKPTPHSGQEWLQQIQTPSGPAQLPGVPPEIAQQGWQELLSQNLLYRLRGYQTLLPAQEALINKLVKAMPALQPGYARYQQFLAQPESFARSQDSFEKTLFCLYQVIRHIRFDEFEEVLKTAPQLDQLGQYLQLETVRMEAFLALGIVANYLEFDYPSSSNLPQFHDLRVYHDSYAKPKTGLNSDSENHLYRMFAQAFKHAQATGDDFLIERCVQYLPDYRIFDALGAYGVPEYRHTLDPVLGLELDLYQERNRGLGTDGDSHHYLERLKAAEKVGDPYYISLLKWLSAEPILLQQALQDFETIQAPQLQLMVHLLLAAKLIEQDEYNLSKAEAEYKSALRLAQERHKPHLTGAIYLQLADLERRRNRPNAALQRLRQAEPFANDEPELRKRIYMAEADVFWSQNKQADATRIYMKLLEACVIDRPILERLFTVKEPGLAQSLTQVFPRLEDWQKSMLLEQILDQENREKGAALRYLKPLQQNLLALPQNAIEVLDDMYPRSLNVLGLAQAPVTLDPAHLKMDQRTVNILKQHPDKRMLPGLYQLLENEHQAKDFYQALRLIVSIDGKQAIPRLRKLLSQPDCDHGSELLSALMELDADLEPELVLRVLHSQEYFELDSESYPYLVKILRPWLVKANNAQLKTFFSPAKQDELTGQNRRKGLTGLLFAALPLQTAASKFGLVLQALPESDQEQCLRGLTPKQLTPALTALLRKKLSSPVLRPVLLTLLADHLREPDVLPFARQGLKETRTAYSLLEIIAQQQDRRWIEDLKKLLHTSQDPEIKGMALRLLVDFRAVQLQPELLTAFSSNSLFHLPEIWTSYAAYASGQELYEISLPLLLANEALWQNSSPEHPENDPGHHPDFGEVSIVDHMMPALIQKADHEMALTILAKSKQNPAYFSAFAQLLVTHLKSEDMPGLYEQIEAAPDRIKSKYANALIQSGRVADHLDFLKQLFPKISESSQLAFLQKLVETGDKRCYPFLLEQLGHPSGNVQKQALTDLQKLGYQGHDPRLQAMIHHESPQIRQIAERILAGETYVTKSPSFGLTLKLLNTCDPALLPIWLKQRIKPDYSQRDVLFNRVLATCQSPPFSDKITDLLLLQNQTEDLTDLLLPVMRGRSQQRISDYLAKLKPQELLDHLPFALMTEKHIQSVVPKLLDVVNHQNPKPATKNIQEFINQVINQDRKMADTAYDMTDTEYYYALHALDILDYPSLHTLFKQGLLSEDPEKRRGTVWASLRSKKPEIVELLLAAIQKQNVKVIDDTLEHLLDYTTDARVLVSGQRAVALMANQQQILRNPNILSLLGAYGDPQRVDLIKPFLSSAQAETKDKAWQAYASLLGEQAWPAIDQAWRQHRISDDLVIDLIGISHAQSGLGVIEQILTRPPLPNNTSNASNENFKYQVSEVLIKLGEVTPRIEAVLWSWWHQDLITQKVEERLGVEDTLTSLRIAAEHLPTDLLRVYPAESHLLKGKLDKARLLRETATEQLQSLVSDPTVRPEIRYLALAELKDLLPPAKVMPQLESMLQIVKQDLSRLQRQELGQPVKQLYGWLAECANKTGQSDKGLKYEYLEILAEP